ncbi:MAG TPA: phage antirepressor N-terminal domain-containing protein [Chloroflexota bacterium]|nr:phage antirepressor N-terminal domain-containing protein [Chloroflexota bacterium]HUM67522.1 phage antirepressor N-terminal domain-containing protein [Chloroflexota bacterium]
MTNKALVPVIQREVIFYEDVITAVQVNVGGQEQIYVPIRPICNYLGLDWSAQYRRVNRDPVLSEVIQGVAVTTMPSSDGRGGGVQEMSCLPLKFLPGWLFGVSANRIKEDLREKIIRYQRESYDVLWEAFQEGRLTADPIFDDLLASDTPAAQAYKIATAIMKMARQQLLLEAQLEAHAVQLVDHEQRLEEIEATLGDPGRFITPDQAMQISQAIKTIATEIQKRTKQNEYGKIYGQMYREFGITSYKLLPANKFDRAMAWLTDMYRQITGAYDGEPPF